MTKAEEYKFYLILGGTLWRINEEKQIYQTFDDIKNSWDNMTWLGDNLEHEVECAKHLGEQLTYEEALKKSQELYTMTQKRLKEKTNKTLEEVDNVKNHPIYKEAMKSHDKNVFKVILCIIGFILAIALFIIIADRIVDEECIKRCQTEHFADDCNGACF